LESNKTTVTDHVSSGDRTTRYTHLDFKFVCEFGVERRGRILERKKKERVGERNRGHCEKRVLRG
jgi:hypothetical protein